MYNFGGGTYSPGNAVTFDQACVPNGTVNGMTFLAPSSVQLTLPGHYIIHYIFNTTAVNMTLALFLDNVEIPGSRYSSSNTSLAINGQVSFVITSGLPALLTLQNVDPAQDITLFSSGLSNCVNTSMNITAMV